MNDRKTRPRRKALAVSDLPAEPPGTADDLAAIVRMVFGAGQSEDRSGTPQEREAVEEHVRHVAGDVLAELRNRTTAPRMQDEVQRLAEISEMARTLQRRIARLNGLTRALLKDGLDGQRRPLRLVGPTPAPVRAAGLVARAVDWPSGSVHPLEALARAAESSREFMANSAKAGSGPGLRRGAGNMHALLIGDVRRHLAFECAQLLGARQAIEAVTGTEGGQLYVLVAAVWLYATGLGVEEQEKGGLCRVVKHAAPIARRVLKEQARFAAASDKAQASRKLLRAETEAREHLFRPPRRLRSARTGQGAI